MKTKIIQLGILAVLISNSVFANGKNDLAANQLIVSDTTILTKPTLDAVSDTIVTLVGYKKTIEEVIKEDNLIIESNITDEVYPLNIDNIYDADVDTAIAVSYKKPIEEVIKEDNLIIESNITNEAFPMNFKSLNKKPSKAKKMIPSHCFSDKCCIKS